MSQFERYTPFIILGLTILGILIRIYRVDYLSLWVDEYIHVNKAKGFLEGGSLLANENNGIFLTILIILSFKTFGVNDFAARLPSVILGGLVIPTIYYLGKKLFNSYIGLFASILATFSLYSIIWSRLSRNYGSFEFSYTLLLLVFLLAFEAQKGKKGITPFFQKHGLNKKCLWLLPFAFILSALNHPLTFFFFFSVGVYSSIIASTIMIKREPNHLMNKYALFLYLTLIVGILFYTPFVGEILRPILGLFLPENSVIWVLPNWEDITSKWSFSEKYKIFSMYTAVLQNDYSSIYVLGFIGFMVAFAFNKKSAIFLSSFFIVPWLLMSFIFRDPALPRYLIYIYPGFLISMAVSLFWILKYLVPLIIPKNFLSKNLVPKGLILVAFCLLITTAPLKEIWTLISVDRHGWVTRKELCGWKFSNWKESIQYLASRVKPDDIVLSTVPDATDYYLNRDNSLRFRQGHFDTQRRRYVANTPSNKCGASAVTFEEFVETVENTERGWLIVDYYFYTVMTDQRARKYVIQNLKYHFDASKDGTVQVFSWDHDLPEPKKGLLIELGKGDKTFSEKLFLELPSFEQTKTLKILIDAEAIDSNKEAFVMINKKYSKFLPKCRTNQREKITLDIHIQWLKSGKNLIQFGYNRGKIIDIRQGYALYYLIFQIN